MKSDALQRQLDLISSALLDGVGRLLRPRLILDEQADTASTSGKSWVRLPAAFLGETPDRRPEIFVGLLAHEVGHWLQPLKEVLEVEKETGLNHAIVNILLDIHGEALIPAIFPMFHRHLAAVRSLVKERMSRSYFDSLKQAKTFLDVAGSLLLLGRYSGQAELFSFDETFARKAARRSPIEPRKLVDLVQRAQIAANIQRADLPNYLRQIADTFPELCVPEIPSLSDLLDTSSGGDAMDALREKLGEMEIAMPQGNYFGSLNAEPIGMTAPSGSVSKLARSLAFRWTMPRSSASIPGPGRLNRLAALRGEPVPFSLPIRSAGRAEEQVRIVLAVDWSGSMTGDPWLAARQAAQAICLGVRANQGDVRALFFAEHSWHGPDYSADALFAESMSCTYGIYLGDADGRDTSFEWLPAVWQAFPNHQVVLLTDGVGKSPAVILPSGRKRTAAILLAAHIPPEARAQADVIIDQIAASSVRVNRLDDLPALWASLIPRKWNA